jgi:hypothetical protein
MGKETRRRRKKVMGVALPDLGPVLLPPWFLLPAGYLFWDLVSGAPEPAPRAELAACSD